MIDVEVEFGASPELSADMIRAQLELLVRDEVFRASKRSVAFLKYVVEQALAGQADQIKERSIGIEVFGRDPSYDTNLDHIVRTAAAELRKRLATYYVDEKHRSELRMIMLPGSYIPRFTLPNHHMAEQSAEEASPAENHHAHLYAGLPQTEQISEGERPRPRHWPWVVGTLGVIALAMVPGYKALHKVTAQDLFWKPVLETPGPVLLAVGDHPNGPPTLPPAESIDNPPTPVPSSDASQTVPFADTVTIARVCGVLAARQKSVDIRRGSSSSFSDLRGGAVVLIGAFNNEWSLRLTRGLRYSLALDPDKHVIYIRDAKNPNSRDWSWGTNQPRDLLTGVNSPKMQDYALISRITDSETGHVVVVIGGLYTYGTQAAGEFLTDRDLMQVAASTVRAIGGAQHLQIVLGTTVTDGTPGPPRVLAVSAE
jgi:hypothetical protein